MLRFGCLSLAMIRATNCPKDGFYLADENCTHIARHGEMEFFRLIFNQLEEFRLEFLNDLAGFRPSAGRELYRSATGSRCLEPGVFSQ